MIPAGGPGRALISTRDPTSRTPLYGMRDVAGKSELSDFALSTAPTLAKPGKHSQDASGRQHEDAWMHDCPSLARSGNVAQQQILETTVVATKGAQKGIYYGSVKWGWKMGPRDTEAKGIPLTIVSKDAPSLIFSAAVKLWNATKTSEDKAAIPLPESMHTVKAGTTLWDDIAKKKKVGSLAKATVVGVTEKSDPKAAGCRYIVVASGRLVGKTGWVQSTEIQEYAGPRFPP